MRRDKASHFCRRGSTCLFRSDKGRPVPKCRPVAKCTIADRHRTSNQSCRKVTRFRLWLRKVVRALPQKSRKGVCAEEAASGCPPLISSLIMTWAGLSGSEVRSAWQSKGDLGGGSSALFLISNALRRPSNQSCREVTCAQPFCRKVVRFKKASTALASPIKSVRPTQITLSRSDFCSPRRQRPVAPLQPARSE